MERAVRKCFALAIKIGKLNEIKKKLQANALHTDFKEHKSKESGKILQWLPAGVEELNIPCL